MSISVPRGLSTNCYLYFLHRTSTGRNFTNTFRVFQQGTACIVEGGSYTLHLLPSDAGLSEEGGHHRVTFNLFTMPCSPTDSFSTLSFSASPISPSFRSISYEFCTGNSKPWMVSERQCCVCFWCAADFRELFSLLTHISCTHSRYKLNYYVRDDSDVVIELDGSMPDRTEAFSTLPEGSQVPTAFVFSMHGIRRSSSGALTTFPSKDRHLGAPLCNSSCTAKKQTASLLERYESALIA